MDKIEEENCALKKDNRYLREKIRRLEKDNSDMELKIVELLNKDATLDDFLKFNIYHDHDMRIENQEESNQIDYVVRKYTAINDKQQIENKQLDDSNNLEEDKIANVISSKDNQDKEMIELNDNNRSNKRLKQDSTSLLSDVSSTIMEDFENEIHLLKIDESAK